MSNNIIKNKYGFYEIKNKPNEKELQAYYADKYYQNAQGSYELSYQDEEVQCFLNKIKQKHQIVKSIIDIDVGSFLDVGAGEGFSLKYFDELGWKCTGLDFSNAGIKKHNPTQEKLLIQGDIFQNLSTIIVSGEQFNLVLLDNVVEHVINPFELLQNIHEIITNNGILVVEVPNDFSMLQQYLLDKNYIDNEFWVSPPDHLSYFNKDGLTNLANATGWQISKFISDYPIDLDLLNSNSNYIRNKNVGKASHKKRIEFENFIHSISIEKTNKFYEALIDLGLGRNITAFLTKQ